MKKLSFIAAAAFAFCGVASAGTDVSSPFNVSVTVTPKCIVSSPATDISFGNYVPFGGALTPAPMNVTFSCSRGMTPVTVAFDGTNGTASASGTGAPTAEGVLQGLRYTLSAGAVTVAAGTAASAGTGGAGGTNGSADTYTFTISANMPAGQAGATTGAATHSRSIILTY